VVPEPTDRDLDAEVAERVMMLPEVELIGERLQYRDDKLAQHYGSGIWRSPVPRYSETYSAAFLVVEHMRGMGWKVVITDDLESQPDKWTVEFFRGDDTHFHTYDAHNPSLPRAICQAALGGVGWKGG
jgi:hypothetical protein